MSRPDWIYGPEGVLAMPERWGAGVRQQQPWPDGIEARYLTIGGATVDIIRNRTSATTLCNGCTNTSTHPWLDVDSPYNEEAQKRTAIEDARRRAQSHASTCRAMPKPETSR